MGYFLGGWEKKHAHSPAPRVAWVDRGARAGRRRRRREEERWGGEVFFFFLWVCVGQGGAFLTFSFWSEYVGKREERGGGHRTTIQFWW